jgi:hypothetical protein
MAAASHESKSHLRMLKKRPLCIITARSAEAAVLTRTFGIVDSIIYGHEVPDISDSHKFYLGSFPVKDGNKLDYYITCGSRQSIQSFVIDAAILLHVLRPRFAIHAGVCAGYRSPKGGIKCVCPNVSILPRA